MSSPVAVNRRRFLKTSVGGSAALVAAPTLVSWLGAADAKAATPAPAAFVDDYKTNIPANLTPETNAVVRVLGGMTKVWKTGDAWNTGTVLDREVLRANVRYSIQLTHARTEAQGKEAFVYDRQHQSYATIGGLGPLAPLYRSGAKAVTSITAAPDGVPATKIDDAVPADAPAGSALGAGSHDSDLGLVATLVDTLRGNYASGNQGKYAYQYPRPWRMNEDSQVVDTGKTDDLGFPVYDSKVVVVPQLLRQRNMSPKDDGGYPSGHTNAFHLASLAYAYAVPERFQELVTRGIELSHTRIMSGMHSTVDVIGGRIMATALAAATLADPANAELKAAARAQALAYFTAKTGTNANTLYAYAHSDASDRYAHREANAHLVEPKLTYVLPRRGRKTPLTVPKGAEVLLETRQPYLTAAQRRAVLRTTALESGYVLLDGFEQWGRLNLFAAADGYGSFESNVTVTMDAAKHGFHAADAWRNDIDGPGGLIKKGSGTLTLTGHNRYHGGTALKEGTLVAGHANALGEGHVTLTGGTLSAALPVRVRGPWTQGAATLDLTVAKGHGTLLTVSGRARLEKGATLVLNLDAKHPPAAGTVVHVLHATQLRGQFDKVKLNSAHLRAVPHYTADGLSVRLVKR
ncbi:phosphatase PAP2 family protein [Streptomyces acidiscabies]|uniref:Phosphatase PAP2 family protein n=1 Tax=Streptomyces acidiscabies TaxID=42234 RepID=A0AAP6ED62_9ACTN|nr:phosphatase PAP2 family protein [Streptomyces acidiscabies]MBP5941608.1 phosphatase PAP2 family protein [Streptomyces sp. LBUM 1476]MBZ3913004.1 phosphatase PAP2 family protein [Streptomyces acidiscabies]MDX2958489.1 phosphatase PAP2 family protein [Streptomyces acidiscabies]MDX3021005.1 phosphatase PAP2 family protein [Streptomyces acidiscabies]MDX3794992.1 phosphatase PAP2 family protein [Streptomyces acidiscabies]